MCRKPYQPERAKKLILSEISEAEKTDSEGLDLLKRLVVLWDAEPENEELPALVGEIRSWLDGGHRVRVFLVFLFKEWVWRLMVFPQFEALTKAQQAMDTIVSLRTEQTENARSIRRLKRDIYQWELRHSLGADSATAREESLRNRVQELEM